MAIKQYDVKRKGVLEKASFDTICRCVGGKTEYWLRKGQATYSLEIVDGNTIIHITKNDNAEKISKSKAAKSNELANKNRESHKRPNTFKFRLSEKDYDIALLLNDSSDPEKLIKDALRYYFDSVKR